MMEAGKPLPIIPDYYENQLGEGEYATYRECHVIQ
jgi:hypothetical protein